MNFKPFPVILIAALCLFAACASAPPEPPPAWAESVERSFPNDRYLARRGTGRTAAEAEAGAVRALAQHFQLDVGVQAREEAVLRGDGPTEITNIEITVIGTSVELFAVHRTRPWHNRGDRLFETVAYINRAEAWEVFEPGVRREESAFLDMFNSAELEGDSLRRFMMLRGAQNYHAANVAPMRSFGERLHPAQARDGFPEADAALSMLPRLLDEARAGAVIYIDSGNDFENRVTQLIERTLNEEGFNISRNRAAAEAVFAVDFDFNMSENRSGDSTSYSFAPSVRATLNGRSGVILSYHSPPQSRTVTLTQEAGRRRSFTTFMSALEDSFPAEFRNSLASFAEGR